MTVIETGVGAIIIGLGATLLTDIWAIAQRLLLKWQTLDYALVGRWLGHMRTGRFVQDNIRTAAPITGERAFGWIIHYAIGAAYGVLLLVVTGPGWLAAPTPLPALAVALATIVAPFFVMQPGMGFGVAASRTPKPWLARMRAVLTHLIFGVGLYLSALALALLR